MKKWSVVYVVGSCLFATVASPLNAKPTFAVPLVKVLTDPETYVGDQISVAGYLEKTGDLHLYLTRDHAEASDYLSAVLVSDTNQGSISKSSCVSSFVEVTGTLFEFKGSYGLMDIVKIYQPHAGVCWSSDQDAPPSR